MEIRVLYFVRRTAVRLYTLLQKKETRFSTSLQF